MAKKWIAGAIKHPGALHEELHVPKGKKIPEKRLEKAAKAGGKLGERARLAETLEGFHHEGKAMRKHEHHEREEHEEKREHEKHGKRHEHRHEEKRHERSEKERAKRKEGGRKHHEGKHAHGKGGIAAYERGKDKAEGPIKVPKSDPWPNDSYVGHTKREHHAERSNHMLSRHDAHKHMKMAR